ncbi:hypothetical protein PTKIN_Ptkin09bG0280300 [Pterospermum kingtungense]
MSKRCKRASLSQPNLTDIPLNPTGSESLLNLTLENRDGLKDCPNLFPIPNLNGFSSLSKLEMKGWEGLKNLPSGLLTCTSLHHLSISNWIKLESIPEDVGQLHSLRHLCSRDCQNLTTIPDETLGCLTYLKTLEFGGFSEELEEFPVKALPEWLGNFFSLRSLMIAQCENLEHLPSKETMQRLSNLQKLSVWTCPGLKENNAELSKISHIPRVYIR